MQIPCVLWPSTYIQQEIECLAVSPDGHALACVCSSGQVYIWQCIYQLGSRGIRLDPTAVALCGWLGSARVLGLAFCRAEPRTVQVAGLSSELLLMCVLPAGLLRLLDPADGRCVGTVPARPCSQPMAVVASVLRDGRHVVLAGHGCKPVIVDIWQACVVAGVAVPGDAQLVRLAAPLGPLASQPSIQQPSENVHASRAVDVGGAGALRGRSQGAMPLQFAATSSETVHVWCWRGPGQAESPMASERVEPSFTFKFARGRGGRATGLPVALALEAGVLVLGTTERLLLWKLREDGAGPHIQVHREESGLALADLAGAQLVQLRDGAATASSATSSATELHEVAVASRLPRLRRTRSWSPTRQEVCANRAPRTSAAEEVRPPRRMLLVAWTLQGEVLCAPVGESLDEVSTRTLLVEPWGSLPKASLGNTCALWWSCGEHVVGAVRSSGDTLCVRTTSLIADETPGSSIPCPSKLWTRAASLEDAWRPGLSSVQVACATLIEVRRCTWAVLGLTTSRFAVSVWAVQLSSDNPTGIEDATPLQLPLPAGCAKATCLASMGPRFLALGDISGLLCWWHAADWRLAGSLPATHRVPIVHLARVWSPLSGSNASGGASAGAPDERLAPEASLLAVLDDLGRCRLADLEAGEVLCVVQSQSGPRLWFDEPLRMTYDRIGRYLCAATPSYACVWDSGSGCFEGSVRFSSSSDADEDAPTSGRRHSPDSRDSNQPHDATSTPGFRCSALRRPDFGIGAVPWQASASPGSEALPPDRRLGDLTFDGPLWRLPLFLLSPAQLVSRLGSGERAQKPDAFVAESPVMAEQVAQAQMAPPEAMAKAAAAVPSPGPGAGQLPLETVVPAEAATVQPMAEASRPASEPLPANLLAPAVPPLANCRKLAAGLASLGLQLPGSPFIVGVVGIDDSLSLPLPPRSADGDMPVCTASASRALLEAALPVCSSSPHIVLSLIIRTLLQSDTLAAPQVLQRWALPALRQVLREAPLEPLLRALRAWTQALLSANSTAGPFSDGALHHCTFGSGPSLRDAAMVLLALVAHLEPWLFDRICPSTMTSLITEALCQRMFTRPSGSQLQSISCEAFALAFPRWRQHLARALPRRQGAAPRGAAAVASAMSPEPRPTHNSPERRGGAELNDRRSPSPDAGPASPPRPRGPDEDLEWFTVQVLALYQEPRVAPSCLSVMMQAQP